MHYFTLLEIEINILLVSACLKFVFDALKLDPFYVNGIIILKKIQLFNEVFYSQQIETFIVNN